MKLLALLCLLVAPALAHAEALCKADSLSCLHKSVGSSCGGLGYCFATKRLWTGDYACSCRRGHASTHCVGGSQAFCLGKEVGESCGGTGTCLPTGNSLGGDFYCDCN